MEEPGALERLPSELLDKVLINLDYDSILNFVESDDKFLVVWNDIGFWKAKAKHDFPYLSETINVLISRDNPNSARSSYIILNHIEGGPDNRYSHRIPNLKTLLKQAIINKNYPLFEYIFGKVKHEPIQFFDPLFKTLGDHGTLKMVKHFVKEKNMDYQLMYISKPAAYKGRDEIVYYLTEEMMSKPTFDVYKLNTSLISAANGGHFELIKFLIEMGADNYGYAMLGAFKNGYKDIGMYLSRLRLRWLTYTSSDGLLLAARIGDIEIADRMVALGADNFESATLVAYRNNNLNMVEYLNGISRYDGRR